ncbi:AraC family transcriptional regulator [Roseibium aggregatum]|uniref:Helix-turn-helix domain-containing protein n=1 Tax=Roseibium aggregatum TaxID=187304 RepID=A0A926P026_9HYPH|nr:AraC family transcriptional regulator [Roseibium aggregatum]MBD1549574.1 helix-turn-helix domain-containing protein [Roseibium aggregatum]
MAAVKEWARADALRVLRDGMPADLLDWEELAGRHGIDLDELDDPEGIVPITALYAVFEEAAEVSGDDARIFDIFNATDIGEFSLFDYLFTCAPTLREGCRAWQRFMQIRSNAYTVTFTEGEDGRQGVLEWKLQDRHGIWRQNMFARMAWAARGFEAALGTRMAPIEIELATGAPVCSSDFQKRYGSRIRFDGTRNRISIEARYLDEKPVRNDNNLYAIIERASLGELNLRARNTSPLSAIAEVIAETMKAGTCTLPAVADTLGMSERSLQRTMENEGVSFRELTAQVRRAAARRYLRETALPIKEVSYLLGYSEVSTFSRAVRQWFGCPPRALRQNPDMGADDALPEFHPDLMPPVGEQS